MSEQVTRDYAIVRLLGSGGMGDVYLAEQRRVGNRRVALKVLNRACSENPELVRRFENEASSAGRINHRNVVTVYESRVTDDGTLYVAMEFVEGKTLGQILGAQGALPLRQAVEIARQVGAGLTAAHKLGIVHRDIKPDNIMLAEEDGEQVVKVLDFGIARLSETNRQGKTRAGVIMGTPGYMSPEQAMGKTADQIDARSDVYSLGMVVYQMLTGRTAFEGKSTMDVLRKHINEPPVPPGKVRPDLSIPASIDAVVLKALEKRRQARQQTVADFAAELEMASSTAATVPFAPDKVTAARLPRPTRERPAPPRKEAKKQAKAPAPSPPPAKLEKEAKPQQAPEILQQHPHQVAQPVIASPAQEGRQGGGYRNLLLIGAVLVVLLVAGVVAVMQMSGTDEAGHRVIDLRLLREKSGGDLDTLDESKVRKAGDGFSFDVKMIDPGSVYLFGKFGDDDYGLWQWLNPSMDGRKQELPIGEWHRFPDGYWLSEPNRSATNRYVLIYVPKGVNWPPAAALRQVGDRSRNGVVDLPVDVAASIRDSLTRGVRELQANNRREARNVTFALMQPEESRQIAFYEIVLATSQ